MKKIKTRYIITICILGITAFLVNHLSYSAYNDNEAGMRAINAIPLELGKWRGHDMPLENLIYKILETKSIIHRSYQSENGPKVFLSIVYYAETKVDLHAPEACLGGKGILVKKTKKAISFQNNNKLIKINLNQLVRKQKNHEELIYYFYKAGRFMGENYIKLRFSLALNRISNQEKSGALIRFSTPLAADDIQKSSDTLVDFIAELYPHIINYL